MTRRESDSIRGVLKSGLRIGVNRWIKYIQICNFDGLLNYCFVVAEEVFL